MYTEYIYSIGGVCCCRLLSYKLKKVTVIICMRNTVSIKERYGWQENTLTSQDGFYEQSFTSQCRTKCNRPTDAQRKKGACFPVLFALFSAERKVAGFLICMLMMRSCTWWHCNLIQLFHDFFIDVWKITWCSTCISGAYCLWQELISGRNYIFTYNYKASFRVCVDLLYNLQ